MPNARYKTVDLSTGAEVLQEATSSSAGAGDAGKIPALDAAGLLDASLMPSGVGAETVVCATSENLSAGQFVNLYSDAGTLKARLADANNARPAHGYVKAATTSPANATVYPLGTKNTDLSGLAVGDVYFLSKTAGGVTDDVSGWVDTDVLQRLGVAIATTAILTEPNTPATLADA